MKKSKFISFIAVLLVIAFVLSGCTSKTAKVLTTTEQQTAISVKARQEEVIHFENSATTKKAVSTTKQQSTSNQQSSVQQIVGKPQTTFSKTVISRTNILDNIPAFSGKPYVTLNNNKPFFSEKEISIVSFEIYSALDALGRCGETIACIGTDIMPTEERGSIGQVKPTGWHTVKYDCVDGKYLYNRCHLIGYQLTGENANKSNLITGTRYLNIEGMLPFENMVADYVKETGNHVMYRVVPIFEGNNLLANGVTMEAYSVEDNGKGIEFFVYCYNAQPNIAIDYATGESRLYN